jgi:hypothetical protein
MMRLDSGSSFEIINWKRVPKPKSSEAIETDVAPKAGSAQQSDARSGRQSDEIRNRKTRMSSGTK